jgi:HAD superfamily hydrolase (TIGR01450 family)
MKELIEPVRNYKNFILDMDGVLYSGENSIRGAKETVERLYEMNKNVKYMTNFPESRRTIKEKLKRVLNLEASEENIMTVAYATALYMKLGGGGNGYVMGLEDLKDEIRQSGITVREIDEIIEKNILKNLPEWAVISLCDKDFYEKANATGQILRSKNFDPSRYLATSKGWGWTREYGVTPGIGCTIAFLKEFSGKEPVVIGKPSNYFTDLAFKLWEIEPEKSLMIGDKWSDIETANKYSFFGIKVETGKQDFFENIEKLEDRFKPKLVLKSIRGIFNENEIVYPKVIK